MSASHSLMQSSKSPGHGMLPVGQRLLTACRMGSLTLICSGASSTMYVPTIKRCVSAQRLLIVASTLRRCVESAGASPGWS